MSNQPILFDRRYGRFCYGLTHAFVVTFVITFLATASLGQGNNVVMLHGAGSTFAAPLFKKWIDEYSAAHRNVTVTFDAVGSGR
jgi:ABC-type phosphate transport system substrate-binding protein